MEMSLKEQFIACGMISLEERFREEKVIFLYLEKYPMEEQLD